MKKIIYYISISMIIIFMLPTILTSKFIKEKTVKTDGIAEVIVNDEKNNNYNKELYNYSNYGKVNVFNSKSQQTESMELDEYLLGVVSAEMPANYEIEALKAQAVVARTYTIYTLKNNSNKHGDMTICTSPDCCQAWISKEDRMNKWKEDEREGNWNKIEEAVYSTKGQIIEFNSEVIDAFFHSNSGGKTEIPVNVWGGNDYPYLQSVETSGEDEYSQFSSEVILSKKDFEDVVKSKHANFSINWDESDCIKINEYTEGNRVRFLKVGNITLSGVEVRALFGLKSANFKVSRADDNIIFSVTGYGHGVGMSQTGADSMAKKGSNYIDIIKHFYSGVEIINM